MDTDISLKLRNAKRRSTTSLNLSNLKLSLLPKELYELKFITNLDLSFNNLSFLDLNIKNLENLEVLNLSNNQFENFPKELFELKNLKTLILLNNPVLSKLKNYNEHNWRSSSIEESSSFGKNKLNLDETESKTNNSNFNNNNNNDIFCNNNFKNEISERPKTQNDISRRKMITNNDSNLANKNNILESNLNISNNKSFNNSNLELENNELRFQLNQLETELKSLKLKGTNSTTDKTNCDNSISLKDKRNWLDDDVSSSSKNDFQTSTNDNQFSKISELESILQKEQLANKRNKNEIEKLTNQLANFKKEQNSFNNNNNNKSYSLSKKIENVFEINYEDLKIGNQIGQGGFSVIYKSNYLQCQVAVKLIFDPKITEELLNEFNNEIKMLSLLRHPNIVLMIGITTGNKLSIVTEFIENGSLFNLLHKTK